ncbi:TPA: GGDEF domain-containing protein [Pseudomonas aeruginosa]|nr:GGDEF domain-containing protein [Pseudomonas aeruginosa]
MRTDKPPLKQRALQKLLLRRFGMAAGTHLLGLVLLWLALLSGFYRAAPTTAAASTTLVVACQLAFLWLFASGRNLRYADPSLTEPQVLVAIAWLTYFLYHVDSLRGTFMVFYVLALLFGVFQLPPRVFARCAALAFIAFSGIYLVEALQQRLELPGRAALQVLVMFIVMVWLSLFASYIQAMRQRMRQRRYALQAHQDTLRGMMRQLEDLVATDELTGLFNRRHFMRLASRALEDLLPNRQHGLALIDLDHFKRINDRHGHAAGDRVLQTFAAVARSCLRDGDVLARYGGEEFVLLLPHADAEQLESCCERLRLAFEQAEPVGVTVDTLSLSVGMTLLYADDDLDEALQRADQALYRAKRGGRNRCDATWEVTSA